MIRNRVLGGLAILFGLVTLLQGGSVLFDYGTAREAAGDFVPQVLWFNFASGFIYILAGVGIVMGRPFGLVLARALVATILLTFAWFLFHILRGGAWEMRTLLAMSLRLGFWILVAFSARCCPNGVRGA